MPSIMIRAENFSVGDILLLPMGKTATIVEIKPITTRTRIVQFKTEFGWSRMHRLDEHYVEARVR